MSKRWKLKTNSSNILLVLITLILIKAEWVECTSDTLEEIGNLEKWKSEEETRVYVGNDEIAHYYFRSPISNGSLVLDELRNCLDSFQLVTCMKMLLLSRINEVVKYVEEPGIVEKDLRLLNGLMIFKRKNETKSLEADENSDYLSLDKEIAFKFVRIFRNRCLLVNLLPEFKIEVEPKLETNDADFICFNYKIQRGESATDGNVAEGRGKKKGGGMGMMMLVPQMIMLGLMPFTLASLKAMVMNAVMINMMALNGAIFMTIRNLVFGPRRGENVKYVNYGYSKDRQTQSKKPVLIIHSPAAFVKQPPVKTHFHHRPVHYHNAPIDDASHFQHGGHSGTDEYYLIQQHQADDGSIYEHSNRRLIRGKEQGNTFGRFNSRPKIGYKNPFADVAYQRKSAKAEMKTQTNQNPNYGFNERSPGLLYTNGTNKKTANDYHYSRQTEKPLHLF